MQFCCEFVLQSIIICMDNKKKKRWVDVESMDTSAASVHTVGRITKGKCLHCSCFQIIRGSQSGQREPDNQGRYKQTLYRNAPRPRGCSPDPSCYDATVLSTAPNHIFTFYMMSDGNLYNLKKNAGL